jgi:hypothetical protein
MSNISFMFKPGDRVTAIYMYRRVDGFVKMNNIDSTTGAMSNVVIDAKSVWCNVPECNTLLVSRPTAESVAHATAVIEFESGVLNWRSSYAAEMNNLECTVIKATGPAGGNPVFKMTGRRADCVRFLAEHMADDSPDEYRLYISDYDPEVYALDYGDLKVHYKDTDTDVIQLLTDES